MNNVSHSDAIKQRDTAWQELREIREAISANPEESTADEVRRINSELADHRKNSELICLLNEYCQKKGIGKIGDSITTSIMAHCDSMSAKIAKIESAWVQCGGYPDTAAEVEALRQSIEGKGR